MSRLRFCLLLAVLCSCSSLGYSDVPKTETIPLPPQHKEADAPETPVIPDTTTSSSTAKPTTTSTTPEPTTTSTTPKPTTTSSTPKPTTTTTTPDTTTPTTTSTTEASTTPHPTPAPGPLPPPTQGTWSFTDAKNTTCIVVQFAAQLNVTYTKVVDNSTMLWHVLINVPANSTVTGGNCTGDQWLTISWRTAANSSQANNITLVYHRNESTKNYGPKSLNVSLTPDNFVNGSFTGPVEFWHGTEWETPLATSYRCKMPTQLNMTSVSGNLAAALTLTSLQEEAYRTTPGTGFSAARECGGGDVPDAVPIAVGCALGGLVVVVLVAYLVGRRRSAARGYLSM